MADRMSKIRYPKKGASDVEYSTFDGGQYRIENRIESFCTPLITLRCMVIGACAVQFLHYIPVYRNTQDYATLNCNFVYYDTEECNVKM